MNLAMAIHTALRHHVGIVNCERGTIGHPARVIGRQVTLLAQERWSRHQHRRQHRTVRRVAEIAVLGHRVMLKQEGSPLFVMTACTSINHARLHQLGFRTTAMGIVAIGAAHLALIDRVMARVIELGPDILVAGETYRRLCSRR